MFNSILFKNSFIQDLDKSESDLSKSIRYKLTLNYFISKLNIKCNTPEDYNLCLLYQNSTDDIFCNYLVKDKNKCYLDVAIKYNDISYCLKLYDKSRTNCMSQIINSSNGTDVCKGLNSQNSIVNCYNDVLNKK